MTTAINAVPANAAEYTLKLFNAQPQKVYAANIKTWGGAEAEGFIASMQDTVANAVLRCYQTGTFDDANSALAIAVNIGQLTKWRPVLEAVIPFTLKGRAFAGKIDREKRDAMMVTDDKGVAKFETRLKSGLAVAMEPKEKEVKKYKLAEEAARFVKRAKDHKKSEAQVIAAIKAAFAE